MFEGTTLVEREIDRGNVLGKHIIPDLVHQARDSFAQFLNRPVLGIDDDFFIKVLRIKVVSVFQLV